MFYVPDQYKNQEMCDRIISDPFSTTYVLDQYKSQQICDKAVDDCLASLKFVPDCFVTIKMIKILFSALYAGENNSILMKILVMLYLIVMEWVFLIRLSIILTLTKLVMMKMVLIPSFIADFWKMHLSN